MRMTFDSGGGRTPSQVTMALTGAGGKIRDEMRGQGIPGVVAIIDVNQKSITTVMSQMGMAMSMPLPDASSVSHPVVSTSGVTSTETGPGEPFAGQPTRHFRFTGTARYSETLHGLACSSPVPIDMEAVVVRDTLIAHVLTEVMALGPAMNIVPQHNDIDPIGSAKLGPGYVAVKRVMHDMLPGAATTVTQEILEARTIAVDPTTFAVPAGLQVQDMSAMGMGDVVAQAQAQAQERLFSLRYDTTAAAGARRATCSPAGKP
jgi:hypothetical protein